MKICHIVEACNYGVGRVALSSVRGLSESGHDVTLIYSPLRMDNLFRDALPSLKNIRLLTLDMRREVGLQDMVASIALYKLLKQYGPFDVIHSHSSKAGGLARIVGLFVGGMQVYHPNAFVTMAPKGGRVFALIERILSWFSDAVIVVSAQEHQHAIHRLRIADHKLKMIYNGIDIGFVGNEKKAKKILAFPEGSMVMGIVGRLTAQKRHDRALDAFALVAGQYPHAQLAIVGDGELRNAIHNQVKELKLENRVKYFEGYDARELMPAFDVLLCSSDYESFGLIFIEALMTSVPIVSTCVGVMDEMARGGKVGFIADDFSHYALAHALQKMLDMSPAARQEMKIDLARQAKKFSRDTMCQAMVHLYEGLMTIRIA